MSRKPRLLKLRPIQKVRPTLATKVTGHNIGNVTYLVSQAVERGRYSFEFKASFLADGSLDYVTVPASNRSQYPLGFRVYAGRWVFLAPGDSFLSWGDGHPVQQGLFEELV